MKFEEAKEKLEQTLNNYKNAINISDISTETAINYQNDKWEDCDENDPKLRFMAGEIFLKHKDLSDNEILGFTMIIECKNRNKISDKDVESEIAGFCKSVDELISDLSSAEDVKAHIAYLAKKAEEESAAMMEQFNVQMEKINKNLKLMRITTIVVAALGIISLIVVQFLN